MSAPDPMDRVKAEHDEAKDAEWHAPVAAVGLQTASDPTLAICLNCGHRYYQHGAERCSGCRTSDRTGSPIPGAIACAHFVPKKD